MELRFQDRKAAGEALAQALLRLQLNDPVVIMLITHGDKVLMGRACGLTYRVGARRAAGPGARPENRRSRS